MKTADLMAMCLQNLLRRKARTFLTVLGVVIGACAIIIMISIGIGMKEAQEAMLSQMGDLTVITVTPMGKSKNSARLDENAVRQMQGISGVVLATPKMTADNFDLRITAGRDKRYQAYWAPVSGIDPKAAQQLGYQVKEGELTFGGRGTVLVGEFFAYNFMDKRRPDGYNMVERYAFDLSGNLKEPPPPYFNPMTTPLELTVSVYQGESEKTVTLPLKVSGVMKEDYARGMESGDGILMSIADFQKLAADVRKLSGLKPDNSGYQTVLVKTSSIDRVAAVEQEIKLLGFNTYSMESIRKPMEQEAHQKQMMLGGLGGISLVVAALGITNTMIMSISERTKEIGIMKALGCFVRDVRTVFLMEAGCIGFIGGIAGILISLAISALMNIFQSGAPPASLEEALARLNAVGSRLSVIPPWLLGFALVFSVLIGLGSGYYPANKAVRISALEAIRHD